MEQADSNVPFLRLPNELLRYICSLSTWGKGHWIQFSEPTYQEPGYREIDESVHTLKPAFKALSLCCKRLHDVVQPLLYRDIDLLRPALLYRTLKETESLRPLCRRIRIIYVNTDFDQEWRHDSPEMYELISWLSDVQYLTISLRNVYRPPLQNVSSSMRGLRKLILSSHVDQWDWFTVATLAHDLGDLPQLDYLKIDCLSGSQPWQHVRFPEGTVIVPENRRGSSSLKELCLGDIWCHPLDLQQFLTWPAALERLTIFELEETQLLAGSIDGLYDTQALYAIFATQEKSLRTIYLSYSFARGLRPWCYDFRRFPQLRDVCMPFEGIPESPIEAAYTLCGPSVEVLSFDLKVDHMYYLFVDDGTVDYLETLVENALKNGSKLKQIFVHWVDDGLNFAFRARYGNLFDAQPAGKDPYQPAIDYLLNACDSLERLKRKLEPKRVEFSYKPSKSLIQIDLEGLRSSVFRH